MRVFQSESSLERSSTVLCGSDRLCCFRIEQRAPGCRSIGFSGSSCRKCFDEMNLIGNLEPLEPFLGPSSQVNFVQEGIAGNHHQVKALAESFVGHSERQHGCHMFVLRKKVLDLERSDLVSAARDDLLRTPDELYAPVLQD